MEGADESGCRSRVRDVVGGEGKGSRKRDGGKSH